MSILIKGMEMPKRCGECPLSLYPHSPCWKNGGALDWENRPNWCPLIELPPHGLIDKQMLLQNIADNQMANSGQKHDLEYGFWQRMWDYINDAPTIIEAEGE